jgi:hypothetical protein
MTIGRKQRINPSLTKAFICSILVAIGAGFCCLGQAVESTAPPAGDSDFEELPELQASEILKPEFVKGPHFTVREPVPTSSGMNKFSIDSEYGVFEADGNAMLVQRVGEIVAIAQLKEVSRTDQFKQSLVSAAKGPYHAAKNVVEDPGGAVSNAGKGLMKFMKRTGNTIKNVSKGTAEKSSDGNKAQQIIGYTRAKRQVAAKLGVDPYSTNSVLQKELDGIAWASWGGGFTFSAATFPISGPAGLALTATSVSKTVGQLINEKTATELKAINRSALRTAGVSANDAERFLENSAFTPTHQTAFSMNLKSLEGVANRGAFVHAAAEKSTSEADAIFCVQTLDLLGSVHAGEHPLARILMLESFPIGIAKDGTVVVALQWDYAAWTPRAAAFADEIAKVADESGGHKPVLVAISGQASTRLQQEFANRKITLHDRVSPGPLK